MGEVLRHATGCRTAESYCASISSLTSGVRGRWFEAAMTTKRRIPPRSDPRLLEPLPQFRPGVGFDTDHVDIETGASLAISPERHKQIRDLLEKHIQPYVRTVNWLDKPTELERFLREAVRAIAIYLDQRNVQTAFDRKKAKKFLTDAADAVSAAQKKLQAIAGWTELSSFLERLLAAVGTGREKNFKMSEETLLQFHKRTRKERKRRILRGLEPKHLALLLSQLEPLLTLAAERVEFQPGDFQRDDAAQNFVDEMALVWIAGTGCLPTYSRQSTRSRRPSPFAELLIAINEKVFESKIRSHNDFREYALKSVKRMKERFPELVPVSGRPHKSG
jgi:hypothetical protein